MRRYRGLLEGLRCREVGAKGERRRKGKIWDWGCERAYYGEHGGVR